MAIGVSDSKAKFRVSHKMTAVERVMRGESLQTVAEGLGASVELVEKWHKQFASAGKNHLRYTCDPGEIPTLEALQLSAQKAFPTRLLHGCHSAASFFCAQFYGKNDVIHLYEMGVPQVTLVDLDTAKLAVMRNLYPQDWTILQADAFETAQRMLKESRKFDAVICDPYSSLGSRVAFDEFRVFQALASKLLLFMYSKEMFDELGIEPDVAALGAAVSKRSGVKAEAVDVIKRSSHAGGIYWGVFRGSA